MAKYRIGLDVGTNSIGWAVTDMNNKLITKKGKKLLGVLMFDESSSGDDDPNKSRRTYRCQRRRIRRRRERLNYLNEIFASEIANIDPTFFERLEESFLKLEDRKFKDKYTLFIDKNFNDKTYFKKFPTIYHLQKHLMESDQKEDIRLIYLAIRHLIKYRGNFLNTTNPENYSSDVNDNEFLNQLNECLDKIKEYEPYGKSNNPKLELDDIEALKKANKESRNISTRKEKYLAILNKGEKKDPLIDLIVSLLSGASTELNKVLKHEEDSEDKPASVKVSFGDDLNDKLLELKSDYSEYSDFITAIEELYKMYQKLYINKYVSSSLPQTMIDRYNQYKSDLKLLKEYIKKYHADKYNDIFNNLKNLKSYPYLVGHNGKVNLVRKKEEKDKKNLDRLTFIDYIKGELGFKNKEKEDKEDVEVDDLTKKLKERFNSEDFLLTQNSSTNGNFPYQLNYITLKEILKKQEKFYPFLNAKDNDGYVNKDKIKSLLTFKIPYYVGPLSSMNFKAKDNITNHSWLIRNTSEHIRPWNFEKVVNKEETAAEFIQRMQNKCTYLKKEYCLPKDSITFEKYLVYQELNTLYVNGNFYFTSENKDDVIANVYAKNRKVNKKVLTDYLSNKLKENVVITYKNGKDKEVPSSLQSLSSLYDFIKVFGSLENVDKNISTIEDIIRDIAIFEDKSILATRLEKYYHLDNDQIKKIKSFNYNKFSRLSKKLLDEIKPVDKNGVSVDKTILTTLKEYDGSENKPATLMEILERKDRELDFLQVIENANKGEESNEKIEDYVANLYLPKISKRPTILACKIVDELCKALNADMSNDFEFYIECARTNKAKKEATKSRYEKVLKLLKDNQAKQITNDIKDKLQELENKKENPSELNSEKIYLYFLQIGKDLYTGEPISLNDLAEYDVDHIIPQSLIKNDSLENKVLTAKAFNNNVKRDIYPLPHDRLWEKYGGKKAAFAFYKKLKDAGFMSNRKYIALTAEKSLENDMLEAFTNKQLTTTNQAVKGLKQTLEEYYGVNSNNIIFSKAENVSDFRNEYDLVKSRTVNNFHHAHDAYLNIFVGGVINKRMNDILKYWTINKANEPDFISFVKNRGQSINPKTIMKNYVERNFNQFNELKNIIYNYKFIFTKTRTFVKKDCFGKATIYPAGGPSNISVKKNLDCKKYGGFKEYSFGYYILIKTLKGEYILEAMPYIFASEPKKYLDSVYKDGYEICLDNLKVNTKFQIEKREFVISGKSGGSYVLKNAIERFFPYDSIKIVKKIDNFNNFIKLQKISINPKKEDSASDAVAKLITLKKIEDDKIIVKENLNGEKEYLVNDDLKTLLNYLFTLYEKDIYSYPFSKSLVNKKETLLSNFNSLQLIEKIYVVSEFLNYLKTNERKPANLLFLGEKASAGF